MSAETEPALAAPGERRAAERVAWGLLGLALAWRVVRFALGMPLWGDEAYLAINLTHRGFAGLLQPLEYGQVAPLGFLWAEHALAVLGGASERALRALPFLAGVAALPLFHRVAFRLFPPREALLAVALFVGSYYPGRHAVELKPYGWDLLVAVLFLFALTGPERSLASAGRWAALTLLAVLSVWCSYPAVFVAGGAGLWLGAHALRLRSPRLAATALVYGVCLAASFAAMVALFAGPHAAAAEWNRVDNHLRLGFPPWRQPMELALWFARIHTGRMMSYPNGGPNGGSAATFALLLVGIVALWRRRRGTLGLLLAPFALTLLAAAAERYPYGGTARVAQHLAPAICLLAGSGLAVALGRLPPRGARIGTRVAVLLLALSCLFGLARDVRRPYKHAADRAVRELVRDLARESGPHDRWIFFNALAPGRAGPDQHEWGGSATRLRFYVERDAPVPVQWCPAPEDVPPRPGTRTFLFAYRDNVQPFPEERWRAYRAALEARLGTAAPLPELAERGFDERGEVALGSKEALEALAIAE